MSKKRGRHFVNSLNLVLAAILIFELMILANSYSVGNAVKSVALSKVGSVAETTKTPSCKPTQEICDGKDNDCNGKVDDGGVCENTIHLDTEANYKTTITLSPEEINKQISEKGDLWIAKENPISKLSDEEKNIRLGLKATPEEEKKLENSRAVHSFQKSSLPDFFDWRNVGGKDYVTSVKDQGNCGSCAAFGAVATLEGHAQAYYNNPNLNLNLSEQDLISCYFINGCEGVYVSQIESLFNSYYESNGVPQETCFPYIAADGTCSGKCANWQQDAWKTLGYEEVPLTVEDIKQALINNGPVQVGLIVYDDFVYYDTGIYSHTTNNIHGYHSATIVGYGNYDGLDYWIVKNSWGTNWGENGYFKIAMGDSAIDSWFAFAVTQPNPVIQQAKLCSDSDNDGYCYWGLGDKPISGCPSCGVIEDCDDSNSSIYQNCGISKNGELLVNSTPSDAKVYVQDLTSGKWVYRGQTPLTFKLGEGNREIKISKEDYDDYLTNVQIIKDQDVQLSPNLLMTIRLTYPDENDSVFRLGSIINITGTIPSYVNSYELYYEKQSNPGVWNLMYQGSGTIIKGFLTAFNTSSVSQQGNINIKLKANKNDGTYSELLANNIVLDSTIKPGWPIKLNGEIKKPVGVGDINGDNKKEIVTGVGRSGSIYAFNYDGSYVSGYPILVGGAYGAQTAPALADINNDGKSEVFIGLYRSIYGLDGKGNNLAGWPRDLSQIPSNLVIADVNNGGHKEIISTDYGDSMSIFSDNGTLISKWPAQGINPIVNTNYLNPTQLAVGDINNNPSLELIGETVNSSGLGAWDYKGNLLSGWPNSNLTGVGTALIADFNLDNKSEIISHGTSSLNLLNSNGSDVAVWPKTSTSLCYIVAIADINNSGDLSLITGNVSSGHTLIYQIGKNASEINSAKICAFPEEYDGPPPQNYIGVNYYSAVIGDINNDKKQDIVYVLNGKLHAISIIDGTEISGFPKSLSKQFHDYWRDTVIAPVLDDIDNDGKTDIILGYGDYIYVWNTNSSYNQDQMEWPRYKYDAANTGVYSKRIVQKYPTHDASMSINGTVAENNTILVAGSFLQPEERAYFKFDLSDVSIQDINFAKLKLTKTGSNGGSSFTPALYILNNDYGTLGLEDWEPTKTSIGNVGNGPDYTIDVLPYIKKGINAFMIKVAGDRVYYFASSQYSDNNLGPKLVLKYKNNFLCGDSNGDGSVNIGDTVFLIQYIFAGGPASVPVLAGDADGNGVVNIGDAVYLIQYIFAGGKAPCSPDKNWNPDAYKGMTKQQVVDYMNNLQNKNNKVTSSKAPAAA